MIVDGAVEKKNKRAIKWFFSGSCLHWYVKTGPISVSALIFHISSSMASSGCNSLLIIHYKWGSLGFKEVLLIISSKNPAIRI